MPTNLVHTSSAPLVAVAGDRIPQLVSSAGDKALLRYAEFFTANIRNVYTRRSYHHATTQFLSWCHEHGLDALAEIGPIHVATYIEALQQKRSAPTVKQHLAGIRSLFDYLVVGQIIPLNPALSVRGPRYTIIKGKTPALTAEETRQLLDGCDASIVMGLRDRALIALMVYTFARVGAATAMRVEDYFPQGKRWWVRLHEKGGKEHEMPAHHNLEEYLDAYIEAAGIREDKKGYLFRTGRGRTGLLSDKPMRQPDVHRMIRRQATAAGIQTAVSCHSFRATGITTYLQGGGTLEKAQIMANHASAKTTRLYDRRQDEVSLDEVERIII
jgi:site-specific recombinase XerD